MSELLEPGKRRKRDLYEFNQTLHDGVAMGKHIRVVLPEDLVATTLNNDNLCMTIQNFVLISCILVALLTTSCVLSVFMWLKIQRFQYKH